MAYQVLARKWRPQDFSSVVGQQAIVTALRNALTEDRVAQAYLFSGIRGVGKTTAARVFAKALNCERGPAADPCNECPVCVDITAGSDLDVIEIDAATYSKVEQVRELTESLKYGPARDRYKVVVLDEIHRLSRQAFDALLKIIEEPPAHLVFIFATTEIDAVPATILSRCQEFHFRRVPASEVAALLTEIAAAESIVADDTALRLIARAGDGSVRDAVALLDQLATFGGGEISDEDAVRLLGGFDTALFEKLLGAIVDGDRPTIGEIVRRIEDEGWDPRHVYSRFMAYARDALHLAIGGDAERVELPREEAERLAERARATGYENLLRLLHQLLASEAVVRRSDAASLAAEIAWLRAAELPRLTRVEEILAGGGLTAGAASGADRGGDGGGGGGGGGRASGRSGGGERRPRRDSRAPEPAERRSNRRAEPEDNDADRRSPGAAASESSAASAAPVAPTAPAAPAAPAAAGPDPRDRPEPVAAASPTEDRPPARPAAGAGDPVAAAIDEVAKLKAPLAAYLRTARCAVADGVFEIGVEPGDETLRRRLERPANQEILARALAAAGAPTRWRLVERAPASDPRPTDPSAPGAAPSDAAPHATVQTVLDIFGGTVEVERHQEE